jgi:hypothetical protein
MKGEVVYLYAFDVADEILTAKVERLLSAKPYKFEIREDPARPRDVPLHKPLAVEPPALPGAFHGQPVRLLVRVYSIGVVTITMRVSFDVQDLTSLLPFHQPVFPTGETFDQVARRVCTQAHAELQSVIVGGAGLSEPEAYTAFCITELDGIENANTWLNEHGRPVAALLNETSPERLSEPQVQEALRVQHTYEVADLVVIDWDAALVVDLGGYVEDVLYVLELANLQLEEFRVMDGRLDAYLERAYVDMARYRPFLGVSQALLRALRHFRINVTRLSDEVTHITKFFGDWYLARVYLGAHERFHLDAWRGSVDRRLGELDQLYGVAQAEVNDRRMVWLELAIVVLCAIDLLAILFGR